MPVAILTFLGRGLPSIQRCSVLRQHCAHTLIRVNFVRPRKGSPINIEN